MNRSSFLAAGSGTAAASIIPIAVRAQTAAKSIALSVVSKTSLDWPTYIAQAQGYDKANGISLEITVAGSAARTAQQLIAGAADIAVNSTSQVLEAVNGGAQITIVAVNDIAVPYAILAKKSLAAMKDLKGKQFIIGGPNDITRVYSDLALSKAGLSPDDVSYTYAGGSGDRFAALMSGGVDAAILAPPFNFMAADAGFVVLDSINKYYSSFPIGNFAVRPDWAQKNEDLLVAFLKVHLMGVRDFYNPAMRVKVIAALIASTSSKPADAAKTYDFLNSIKFFSASGIATPADMDRVVNTLVKTGDVKPPVPPLTKYTDFHYAAKADAQLKIAR